jgi:hypothetical protein
LSRPLKNVEQFDKIIEGQDEWFHPGLLTNNERAFAVAKLNLPSQDYLNNILSYDPETGELHWRRREDRSKAWNTRYSEKAAGCRYVNSTGARYVSINIDGRVYLAHRIIWKIVNGADPIAIDHINGDGQDNRLHNIRSTSLSNNQRNKRRHRNNKSGYCGVFYDRSKDRWSAYIRNNGRGAVRFKTKEEAILARKKYVDECGNFTSRHGT